jgi:hypothetical protein
LAIAAGTAGSVMPSSAAFSSGVAGRRAQGTGEPLHMAAKQNLFHAALRHALDEAPHFATAESPFPP